tara:strand:- start:1096 stop:1293 length:198 start_codon:yes stop_codon:yes gene_type:complete
MFGRFRTKKQKYQIYAPSVFRKETRWSWRAISGAYTAVEAKAIAAKIRNRAPSDLRPEVRLKTRA